jgi:Caspase domain
MRALFTSLTLLALLAFETHALAGPPFKDDGMFETDFENPGFVSIITGVSDYANPGIAPLPGVNNDVAAMKDLANVLGHAVYAEPAEPGKRLTSLPPREFLKRLSKGVELSSSSEPRKIGGNDVVFFYFSGHGFSLNNENYLALRNLDPNNPLKDSVGVSDLVSALAVKRPRAIVLVLDMCRSAVSANLKGDSSMVFSSLNNQFDLVLLRSQLVELQPWQNDRPDQGVKLFAFFSTPQGAVTFAKQCSAGSICSEVSPFTKAWIGTVKDWMTSKDIPDLVKPWNKGKIEEVLHDKYFNNLREIRPDLNGNAVSQSSDGGSVPPVYTMSTANFAAAQSSWGSAILNARSTNCLQPVVNYAHAYSWSPNRVAALRKIKAWQNDKTIGPTIGSCSQASSVAQAPCQVIKQLQLSANADGHIAVNPDRAGIPAADSAVCKATEIKLTETNAAIPEALKQIAAKGFVASGGTLKEAGDALIFAQQEWDTKGNGSFESLVLNNSAFTVEELSRSFAKSFRDPSAAQPKLDKLEFAAQSFPPGKGDLAIAWSDSDGSLAIKRPSFDNDVNLRRKLSARVMLRSGPVDLPFNANSDTKPVDFGRFLGKLTLSVDLEGSGGEADTFEDSLKDIAAKNNVFFITIAYSNPSHSQSVREIQLARTYEGILNAAFRSKIDYSQIISARSNELAGGAQNFDIRFFGVRK